MVLRERRRSVSRLVCGWSGSYLSTFPSPFEGQLPVVIKKAL